MTFIAANMDTTSVLGIALLLAAVYVGIGATYRLYFSPLAKFPGPKLAALTSWYEFYYDVWKRGQFTFHVAELHKSYGPIIRINPSEIHVNDPEFTDVLYGGPGRIQDKHITSANMFGNAQSVISTLPHEHHRIRRAALNRYFSKQSVARLEPLIRAHIETLCQRFEEFRDTKEPVDLEVAFVALTTDIITEYSFSKPYGYLKRKNFSPEWMQFSYAVAELSLCNKQFPFLLPMMMSLPKWVIQMVDKDGLISGHLSLIETLPDQVIPIMRGDHKPSDTHPTIFHELMSSDMPASEKTLARLLDEAQTIVGAGSMTGAHYLKTTTYHILASPAIVDRLREELSTAMPNASEIPPLATLESLPYFNAVIKEGFRISYGITSRLTRIAPNDTLHYQDYVIPPGAPVAMTSITQHDNEILFPDPKAFKPERWLEPGAQRLEKYLLNFSKGPRACLGINLARAEIYLTMAAVFGGRFWLELWDTDRSDVDVAHDFFSPAARADSKGCRVLVI